MRGPAHFCDTTLDLDEDFLAPDLDVVARYGLDSRKPDGLSRAHVKPSPVVQALQSIPFQFSVREGKILM